MKNGDARTAFSTTCIYFQFSRPHKSMPLFFEIVQFKQLYPSVFRLFYMMATSLPNEPLTLSGVREQFMEIIISLL